MPLYKYRCNDCDNVFKLLCLDGEEEEPKCPKCGSTSVERMVSRVGLRFKGNGFYRTDYKNNGSYKGNGGSSGNGNGSKEKRKSEGSPSEGEEVQTNSGGS